MAITFLEKRKFQRNLILVFLIVVLIILLVLWRGFFIKERPAPTVLIPFKMVEIDFKTLASPLLKELLPFEEIRPFEVTAPGERIGRENPFIPY